jgi:hypothetical protein
MTASKGLRAKRSDAGIIRPTGRDVAVLRWLGEMYGAPLSVVAELYGVGERAARRYAGRLEQAGFAGRQLAPAGVWLVPTRRGLRYAGLDYDPWTLVGWKADHTAAVARLRLHLERQYPTSSWTSERALKASWHGTGARVRIPDGMLEVDGQKIGLEVELHRKAEHRYPGICADVDPDLDQVWWFVPSTRDAAWLFHVLDGIPKPDRPKHTVLQLPEGVTS